jgi:two-component system, LytTR family, response regulator
MSRMKTIIIDDEPANNELMRTLLRTYAPQVELVGEAGSVAEGCREILRLRPDLIFLDVEMEDGTGFDLLRNLRQLPLHVIFITAHQQFAIDAFSFSAIDYLLKPVSPMRLVAAVEKAAQAVSSEELLLKMNTLLTHTETPAAPVKKLVLKTLERVYVVESDEIVRMESSGSYTTVFLADGTKILVSRQLLEFDQLLTPLGFMRVHQSHLVNMKHLFYFDKMQCEAVMKDSSHVPVATRKKEQLLQYIENGQART